VVRGVLSSASVLEGVSLGVPQELLEGVSEGVVSGVLEGVSEGVISGVLEGVGVAISRCSRGFRPGSCAPL
jgi:hypothetical protein